MFPPCSMLSLPTIYSLSWRLWGITVPPVLGMAELALSSGERLKRDGCIQAKGVLFSHLAIMRLSTWPMHVCGH
jgi:hypothetical protein